MPHYIVVPSALADQIPPGAGPIIRHTSREGNKLFFLDESDMPENQKNTYEFAGVADPPQGTTSFLLEGWWDDGPEGWRPYGWPGCVQPPVNLVMAQLP